MRIAISSTGVDLNSQVDERFGRALYFILVDSNTGDLLEVLHNGVNVNAPSGAGISSAQMVCDAGANAVITGSAGPKAFQVLEAAGVKIYTGAAGSVAAAVESFKAGKLESAVQGGSVRRGKGLGRGGGRGQGGGGSGRRGGGR